MELVMYKPYTITHEIKVPLSQVIQYESEIMNGISLLFWLRLVCAALVAKTCT